ncbi:hypothetical protein R3W88_001574 [Solanum pinnatisectum]|uniref:Peptidase A1 domain-containing protein n=1 Tax=Solanum pinnatisectum TaxID=50273 RepID=A0AAV9MME5_9SOLN|nr:hypothetical protein R3W88_001574 [Solanum pinnatisectum]
MTFKFPLPMLLLFLLLNIFLCSSEVLYLPVTKDASTLQYITEVSQRTPLIPIKLLVHLGGRSLWVDCDKGFKSSTYKPGVCNSTQCTYSNPNTCGDCVLKPKLQPGCNNNSCYIWGENPLINWFDDSAEIADDVLVIGSTPGVRVTWPRFIFACFVSRNMVRLLANGVTGIAGFGRESPISIPNQLALDPRFTKKFGICLSSSTTSRGVIFIGSGPYYVYNPKKIDISNDILYTKLIANKNSFLVTQEYYIQVSSIKIAGQDIPLNKTLLSINKKDRVGGTRISTASPYTILHPSIYDAFKTAFINALPKNVALEESPMKQFDFALLHKPSAFWRIYGTNSVVQVSKDVMCLAFVKQDEEGEPSIVIGGHQLEENLLIFDLPGKKIGFSSSLKLQQTSCAQYDNI